MIGGLPVCGSGGTRHQLLIQVACVLCRFEAWLNYQAAASCLSAVVYDDRRRSTLPSVRPGSTARSPIRERLG